MKYRNKSHIMKLFFSVILWNIACFSIFSQSSVLKQYKRLKFESLTIKDGLSENTVNCIVKDTAGYMWFGTNNGLNKYNGYEFTVYRNNPKDSLTISSSLITCLFVDSNGTLWVGTRHGGLNTFNPEKNSFTHYKKSEKPGSISHNHIKDITEDKEQNLWIATWGGGLNRFPVRSKRFEHFKHKPDDPNSPFSDKVSCVIMDSRGDLWLGSDGKAITNFKEHQRTFTRYVYNSDETGQESNNIGNTIIEDNEGTIWVATEGIGFFRFNKQTGNFDEHYTHSKNKNSLSNDMILDMYEDKNGVFWITTDGGGLNLFDRFTKTFMCFRQNESDKYSLNRDAVFHVFEDDRSIKWLGNVQGGVNYHNPLKYKFHHYRHDSHDENSISNNAVIAITQDKQGFIWFGTDNGLNRFSPTTETFQHYFHQPQNSNSLSGNVITTMLEDSEGNFWIGTYTKGLNRFDRKNNRFIRYRHNPNDTKSLGHHNVWCLYEDSKKRLWIGLLGGGLDRFDRNTGTFIHYKHNPQDKKSLSHNKVSVILEDSRNNLWIGTEDGGLNLFNEKKQTFSHFRHNPKNQNTISNDDIRALFEDSKGRFWVGTEDGGLNQFIYDKQIFTNYRMEDGLPSNSIHDILEDENRYLWISTINGIVRCKPGEDEYQTFDVEDGLQSNQFHYTSCLKSQSGRFYFGGINGFNAFYPDSIKRNPYIPPVVITDFKIFNKSVNYRSENTPIDKPVNYIEEIVLDYQQDMFSFDFVAIGYTNPMKNLYRYKMEGFDRNWIETTADKRTATYTNLNHGEYTFHVIASNNDERWNTSGKSIKIKITPPYWKTLWFKHVTIIGGVLLIIALYLLRIRNVKKSKRYLEEKVKERTIEITKKNKELNEQKNKIIKSYRNVKILGKIGNEITNNLATKDIIETVFEQLNTLMDATTFCIGRYIPEKEALVFSGAKEDRKTLPYYEIPLNKEKESLAVLSFVHQKEIFINHFTEEYQKYIPEYPLGKVKRPTQSVMYVPLNIKDKKIGVLSAQSLQINAYTDYHLNMLNNIAIYTSIALDNAGVYIQLKKQTQELKEANAQLEEQQEEINQQSDRIREVNKKLSETNEELVQHREYLETEVKKRTADLQKAKERAERSDKLKTAFLANMSHEIRTPLNAILGFTTLFLEEDLSIEERKEYEKYITGSAETLMKLIDDIIDISKIEAGEVVVELSNCQINRLLFELFATFQQLLNSKNKSHVELIISRDVKDEDFTVKIDQTKVKQILSNLLSNAVKFTDKGSIDFGYQIVKPKEEFITVENINFVPHSVLLFFVKDTGIGMEKEQHELIFNRFEKVENKTKLYRGAGLGLSISRSLCEMMGGKIWVDSVVNQGSHFYFTIPIA